jgi:hypothetical protein
VDNETSKNIRSEWDRMNTIWFRYWCNFEESGKILNPNNFEEHKKHWAKFRREVQFLLKSACDYEFHQYLNKRLDYTKEKGRKEGIVIRKHMKELARYIILDKIRQKEGRFATIRDVLPTKNGKHEEQLIDGRGKRIPFRDNKEALSYAQLHRMIDKYYPELLTTRDEQRKRFGRRKYDDGRRIEDHRERIIETQFSRKEKVPSGIFDLVVARAMGKDATPQFLKQARFQAKVNSQLQICDPIDIAKLIAFRADVLEIIDDLRCNPFIDAKHDRSSLAFKSFVESLFFHVRALTELRWFREKSPKIQDEIIWREPRLPKYSKRNAQRAVTLSLQWHKNPETVLHLMDVIGSLSARYLADRFPKMGLWLSQECLKQLQLSDEWKANTCYNIAMSHFLNRQSGLMLKRLKESLAIYERIGGHPGDEADAYGYIAEYWRLRNFKRYMLNRNKAEELLKSTILTPRRKAFHYLWLANGAVESKDIEWAKRLYGLGLLLTGKDASLEEFANFFSQCLADLERTGKVGPVTGPGRYPLPQDWADIKISASFGMIIADPDFGN